MPEQPMKRTRGIIWPVSNAHATGQLIRVACGYCPGERYYLPNDVVQVFGDIDIHTLAYRIRCERCGRGDNIDRGGLSPSRCRAHRDKGPTTGRNQGSAHPGLGGRAGLNRWYRRCQNREPWVATCGNLICVAGFGTMTSWSSESGRCSPFASDHGATSQVSVSSRVVRITGIAFS